MNWAAPSISHHCTEATMSVLALCNTELEDPHLLAVGGNLGSVDVINLEKRSIVASFMEMHENNVIGIEFRGLNHILSFDERAFLHIDLETSNRTEILGNDPVRSISFHKETSPVFAAARDNLYLYDFRTNPIALMEQTNITELCLLPDEVTLMGLRSRELVALDVRNPTKFYSLNIGHAFERMIANDKYLVAVTDDCQVFAFELPLHKKCQKRLIRYDNPVITRPAFIGEYVVVGDRSGSLFVVDIETENLDVLQIPQSQTIVSIAGSRSEIAVALEDEIYVLSEFPMEENLIREDEEDEFLALAEEEEQRESWLVQPEMITVEPGECTYERYGYCEQQVFVCFTCMHDHGRPFGVCEQCALICHDGHDVRAIGNRRRFRCDCGNDISHHPCMTMYSPKTSTNPRNVYNHNFFERWCTCDGPDLKDEPMVQCICCDDWYHHRCIGMFSEKRCIILEAIPELDDWVFVCNSCLDNRLTFIEKHPDGDVPEVLHDFVRELRRDYLLDTSGEPDKVGVGFRILGGRWISKKQFSSFHGNPEFDAEFEAMNTEEEDQGLPLARGQADFARTMKNVYIGLFQKMEQSGRTVVQSSDVKEVLRKEVSRALQQRRDDQEDA